MLAQAGDDVDGEARFGIAADQHEGRPAGRDQSDRQ
jgi:hypothetical protein